jgi:hypothetical protein
VATARQRLATSIFNFAGEPLQPQMQPTIPNGLAVEGPVRNDQMGVSSAASGRRGLFVNDQRTRVDGWVNAHFAENAVGVCAQIVLRAIASRSERDVMKGRRRTVRREPPHRSEGVPHVVGGEANDGGNGDCLVVVASEDMFGETRRVEAGATVPHMNDNHGGPSAASWASIASRPARIDVNSVVSTGPPVFSERAI